MKEPSWLKSPVPGEPWWFKYVWICGWVILLWLFGLISTAHADPVINMDRVMQIESGGNEGAYNRTSQARGLYQITPICLKDFNEVNGTSYKVDELFDPQINARVAYWYMNNRIPSLFKAFGVMDTVDHRLWAYNAGVGALKRGIKPKETRDYIVKYHKGEL